MLSYKDAACLAMVFNTPDKVSYNEHQPGGDRQLLTQGRGDWRDYYSGYIEPNQNIRVNTACGPMDDVLRAQVLK